MKKKSNHEKSIDELTPSAPVPPPSPLSMDEKPSATDTSPMPTSGPFFPLANDATSHEEISLMENDKYSQEIINEAKRVFNLEKLRDLKKDKNKLLEEAKAQINKLCQSIAALEVHGHLFKVSFLINLGYILNEIRPTFQNRAAYVNWRRNNFSGHSQEYFQHAHRLAEMGNTAIKYRSIGVNRLLEVDRLQRALGKSLDDLLKEHAFPDTNEDFGGELFKAHVDAIISYYRFIDAGVDLMTMGQALQMVQYDHKDFEVREVNRFKRKYDKATDKDAFLNKYVLNKMALTGNKMSKSMREESLNEILGELNDYFRKRSNHSEWLGDLKELLDRSIFNEAYGHLTWLRKKLKTRPPKDQKSSKKKKK
jgi:hypothetical protein